MSRCVVVQGMAADELIAKIAKGSKTFESKTAFAKEKYIAKKQKRHLTIVHVEKPTIKSVADVYFNKMPQKIWYPLGCFFVGVMMVVVSVVCG